MTVPRTVFTLRLAGIPIRVEALYPSTRQFCGAYLCSEPPVLEVRPSRKDIDRERERSARTDEIAGHPVRHFPDTYLETLAVYRQIAECLPFYDTLLFHGSCVAVDGAAYLFTAPSGTGKSTHARLWRELLGSRAVMVNDDKPLIRWTEGGATVYGTPWDGKHRLSNNISAPLRAIGLLERGPENRAVAVTPSQALPVLLGQAYRPADAAAMAKTMELIDRLAERVSLWRIHCNMELGAAETAFGAMRGTTSP